MGKIIKWLWHNSRGQYSNIAFVCVSGVLRVLLGLGFVFVSKHAIDIATNNSEGDLILISVILGVILVLEIVTDTWNKRLQKITEIRLQNRMQRRFFSHLLSAEWKMIERHHSGDLVNRLEQDVKDVVTLLATSIPQAVTTIVQFLAAFVFLFLLNSTLAWVVAAIMPFFLIVSKIFINRMRRLTHDIRKSDSRIQSVMQESIQHNLVIKTLEQNGNIIGQLDGLQDTLYGQVRERTNVSAFSRAMVMAGFGGGYLAAFLWGTVGLSRGSVTFGMMGAFLQLVGQIQRPVVGMSALIPTFISGYTASERLMELESFETEEQGKALILRGESIGIRFNNVSFRYEDGSQREILRDFSLEIRSGESVAILGQTGAGKTTLIRLLLALIKPQGGNIVLCDNSGDHHVSALTRGNFVYVPQGNTLFSGTIRDNLLMGNPIATDEEIQKALCIAAAEFVFDLPEGLETLCTERGGRLSEGQAQRIAIARALLRPGKILLLDEATSALDPETERTILERLHVASAGRIVIFVTHRAAVTDYCDRTITVSKPI